MSRIHSLQHFETQMMSNDEDLTRHFDIWGVNASSKVCLKYDSVTDRA
jgi:hypothetical protein